MASVLMNAHNLMSSCCGPAGNVFSKIFNKDDDDDQPQTQQPASKPAAAASKPFSSKKFGFTDKEAKYEDVPWSKMPLSAKKAAKVIGFEQASWDAKEWKPIDDKHWHDLTDEETKACETLGWEKVAWDHKYHDSYWKDMPAHVQKAWEKLGWTQQLWDEDHDVPSWHKGWEEFTDEEKRCMHVIGYIKSTWD